MKKTVLREYAKLIARKGVNIQKGQEVVIRADLDQPEFVKVLVRECYLAGASDVTVDWSYQPLAAIHTRYRSQKVMSTVLDWELEKLKYRAKTLPCMIYLTSEDPDGLRGINQTKLNKARKARYKVTRPISRSMENKYQWCIAGVPGAAWAKKLFPGERVSVAIEKLWQAILKTSRAETDPLAAWDAHNADLLERYTYLNSLEIESLHYSSSNGTDFTVGMNPEGVFHGGGDTTLSGVYFNPNIPSEEIFTTPQRGVAEGVLVATKPLSWQGSLIEDFSIRFHEGRAVEVRAARGEEALQRMIRMDEGAAYLGECALIDFDSPINRSGILFYNTLFDENACCHVALGRGFNDCVKGYEELSQQELRELGVNDSLIHVDFMIGSRDLDITGITADGTEIPVFRNGSWAR